MSNWFNKLFSTGSGSVDPLEQAIAEDTMNTNRISYGTNLYNGSTGVGTDGLNLGSMGSVGSTLNSYVAPAGLAMNAYSTFFGQGKEAFDKNMTLLNQQIESNQDKLGRRKALNNAWAGTESNKNAGLAASGIA